MQVTAFLGVYGLLWMPLFMDNHLQSCVDNEEKGATKNAGKNVRLKTFEDVFSMFPQM